MEGGQWSEATCLTTVTGPLPKNWYRTSQKQPRGCIILYPDSEHVPNANFQSYQPAKQWGWHICPPLLVNEPIPKWQTDKWLLLAGSKPDFQIEMPCHGPEPLPWFRKSGGWLAWSESCQNPRAQRELQELIRRILSGLLLAHIWVFRWSHTWPVGCYCV